MDTILRKKAGAEHSAAELTALIDGYVAGSVPDYQMSAWLMAVCWRGMSAAETAALTQAMANSGEVLDLSSLPHTVDKHSTGGVGDKTTVVLAPLLAACGGTVAKMSGRGLGHTGGTVDKLESIPGFTVDLSEERFMRQAREVGIVVTGQSKDLAPADGLIYALRDTTGTVDSIPLIASSIMSKKLAGGSQSIVLDVKVGSGAFMTTLAQARELALAMTAIGRAAGRKVSAIISDMSEPLGLAVGNALEIEEAVRCLKSEGPADLEDLCVTLALQVLRDSGLVSSEAEVRAALSSGRAYEKLEQWVSAQGGDAAALGKLELAPDEHMITAGADGFLTRAEARAIGEAVGLLGGGRAKKGDPIDYGVGVTLHSKVGERVSKGQPLATVLHRGGRGLDAALHKLSAALVVGPESTPPTLVLETGLV
ncbi:MAG: thymidine phosphorylase [Trueperaceae bacterium]|nr:thymidine phosphorylase [Trueperaceae bacterium]